MAANAIAGAFGLACELLSFFRRRESEAPASSTLHQRLKRQFIMKLIAVLKRCSTQKLICKSAA